MKDSDSRAAEALFPSGHQPPTDYQRPPEYDRIVCDKDVTVRMRDGVEVVVDVYRPDAPGKFPVLFAFGVHSKELQGNELPKAFPPQPSWSSLWLGPLEAGDTEFFRIARLRSCDRLAARLPQIRRWRFARVGQLRPDRMDREAALVRRQCRHGRHRRVRRRSNSMPRASSRRCSRRSSRTIRAAPTANLAVSARNIPAACCTLSAISWIIFRRSTPREVPRVCCRRTRRRTGAKRSTIPTIRMYPHLHNV